jgi:histidyl-tRNA synthetase
VFTAHPELGTVCSGGRYDNLASDDKHRLPGVGGTIGISRILGFMFARDAIQASRSTPTAVLVALGSEGERARSYDVARQLRSRGIATEVFHAPLKFGKQIRYAGRKGIPFVLFPAADGHALRDIRTGQQVAVDPATWMPPAADLQVQLQLAEQGEGTPSLRGL